MVRSRVLLSAVFAALAVTLAGCDETGVYPSAGYVAPFYAGGYYGAPYYGGGYYGGGYYGGGYRRIWRVWLAWRGLPACGLLPWRLSRRFPWRWFPWRRLPWRRLPWRRLPWRRLPTALGRSGARQECAGAGLTERRLVRRRLRGLRNPGAGAERTAAVRSASSFPAARGTLRALRTTRSTDSARRTTG